MNDSTPLPDLPPMLPKGEQWGGKRFDWIVYELVDGAWQIDSRWESREKAEFHFAGRSAERTFQVRNER